MVQSVSGGCKLNPKFVVQSNRFYAPGAYSIAPQISSQVCTHPKLTEPSRVSLHCLQWKFAVCFGWSCWIACTPTANLRLFAVESNRPLVAPQSTTDGADVYQHDIIRRFLLTKRFNTDFTVMVHELKFTQLSRKPSRKR